MRIEGPEAAAALQQAAATGDRVLKRAVREAAAAAGSAHG